MIMNSTLLVSSTYLISSGGEMLKVPYLLTLENNYRASDGNRYINQAAAKIFNTYKVRYGY